MICRICKNKSSFISIDSYKHIWFFCKNCKNIFSKKKSKRDSIFKLKLVEAVSNITNSQRLRKLLLFSNISGKEFYTYSPGNVNYYTGNYFPNKMSNNKWKNHDEIFIKNLEKYNINLNSKKILSISDEPGTIVQTLSKYTRLDNITLTAYEKNTAYHMNKILGCKVIEYDLNNDKLSNLVNDSYDLIFFRSTLNFNLDFVSIFNELDKISKKNTQIIFNFHTPTISSCLMWMFDDYTLLSLVNFEYIESLINKTNFKIIEKRKVLFNPRKYYYNTTVKKLFYYPFYFYYLFKFYITNFNKNYIDNNFNEVSYKLILKKFN